MAQKGSSWAMVLLLVVALVLASVGCGKEEQREGGILKIGALLSLTGPGAFAGLAFQASVDMAVSEVNANGGLTVGDVKYDTIKVVYYDDKYSAAEAVTGIKKLVEVDGVRHVIGPVGSPSMMSIADIVEANKVLVLGAGSIPERIGPSKPHIFAMFPSAKEMQPAVTQWVTESHPEANSWYGIVPNNDTGWSDITVCLPRLKAAGWTILGWELYDPTTTDFYPMLTKIMAKNPDMIDVGSSSPGAMSLIWKQLGELGYDGLKLSFSGLSPQALLKTAGPEGVREGVMSWFDYEGDKILDTEREFVSRLATFSGRTPGLDFDAFSAMGAYDATLILFDAMIKAETTDPTKLAAYIQDMEYEAVDGVVTFGGVKTFGIKRMVQKDIMVGYWDGDAVYHNAQRIHVDIP